MANTIISPGKRCLNTMVPVCNTSPHKFIFQRNIFYSKNKVLTHQSTNHSIAKPAKAHIHLSEGWWFDPTHGFYIFLCSFCIFSIFKRLPQHFRKETQYKWPSKCSKELFKTISNIMYSIKLIRNCKKPPSK